MKWQALVVAVSLLLVVASPGLAYYTQKTLNFDADSTLHNNTKLGGSDVTVNGPTDGPVVIASQIVNLLLLTLGLFCIALLIYAGYIWLIARGNKEEAEKAKKIITGTVIGLLVVLTSYGVTEYIFRTIVNATA